MQAGACALDNKERITAGGAEDLCELAFLEWLGGLPSRQLDCFGGVQWLELNLMDDARVTERCEEGGEGVLPTRLFGSDRAEDENTFSGGRTEQSLQPFQGVRVAPLEVVDEGQEWMLGLGEYGAERFVELKTLPALTDLKRLLRGGLVLQDIGSEPGEGLLLRRGEFWARGAQWL